MLARRKADFEYDAYDEYELVEEPVVVYPRKTKKKKAPERVLNRSLRLKCLALVVLCAVLAALTTVRSEWIVTEGYSLVKLRQHTMKLERENERLKLDIAKLKTPERIRDYAIKHLGMVMPKDVYFASQSGN